MAQDFLQSAAKPLRLLDIERGTKTRRMNAGAPEALVGIDIADPAQDRLVEKQRFDTRTTQAKSFGKFCGANLKVLSPKTPELGPKGFTGEACHTPEAARIGVAKLAAIVEFEEDVSVLLMRLSRSLRSQVTRHAKMHEQRAAIVIG